MNTLPECYCESMKGLLGEEYKQYLESFSQKPYTAFRINTGKVPLEQWNQMNPFSTAEVAWTEKGFYFDSEKEMPSKHPYYFAGLYYIQEPSAMIPASILPIAPKDRVLDLCAAPGGKATELGAKLRGSGLLVANDISVSRTMALAKNLQMAGIRNAVVTAETPERLASVFKEYFDKILIDAPCSGEGMFRREPRMIKDWLEKGPLYYAELQKQILAEAYHMLKPNGMLVYSTCTFSVKEDEEVIQWLLTEYPDMKICPIERKEGFSPGRPDLVEKGSKDLIHCIRIFPHRTKGEGHFAVLLQKSGRVDEMAGQRERKPDGDIVSSFRQAREEAQNKAGKAKKKRDKKNTFKARKRDQRGGSWELEDAAGEEMETFLKQFAALNGTVVIQNNMVSVQPWQMPELERLHIVYQGLSVCEWKHKVNASHQLALTLTSSDYGQVLNFKADDEQVIRYLKGETLMTDKPYQGNVLICVDGFGLGWAQGNGKGTLKNKYYPGWRYQ